MAKPWNPLANAIFAPTRKIFRRFPRFYFWTTFLPRMAIARISIRYASAKNLGKPLNKLDHSKHVTSDTVFILATGSSINGYPDSHWKTIEAHDSIGLNFFLLHDHVPTYYVMEKVLSNHRALLEIRAEAHDGVPLILGSQIGNLHLGRLKFRLDNTAKLSRRIIDRIYYSYDLLPPGHKEHQMVKAYELMNRLGLFKVKRRFRMLTKRRDRSPNSSILLYASDTNTSCCVVWISITPSTSTIRSARNSSQRDSPYPRTRSRLTSTTPTIRGR